jgi:hypothetical protein
LTDVGQQLGEFFDGELQGGGESRPVPGAARVDLCRVRAGLAVSDPTRAAHGGVRPRAGLPVAGNGVVLRRGVRGSVRRTRGGVVPALPRVAAQRPDRGLLAAPRPSSAASAATPIEGPQCLLTWAHPLDMLLRIPHIVARGGTQSCVMEHRVGLRPDAWKGPP